MEGDGGEDDGVEGGEGDGVRGRWEGIGETGEYAMINPGGLGGDRKKKVRTDPLDKSIWEKKKVSSREDSGQFGK